MSSNYISAEFVIIGKRHSPATRNILYDICSIKVMCKTHKQMQDENKLSESYTAVLLSTFLFYKHNTATTDRVYVSYSNRMIITSELFGWRTKKSYSISCNENVLFRLHIPSPFQAINSENHQE